MRISDLSSDLCSSDLRACFDRLRDHRTSKQIARILGIAKPTVDQRIAAARVILGASNRGDAALRYARHRAIYGQITYDPMHRSEERRVGKECGSKCRYRWSPYH